jgi:hypothetical protein
MAALFYPPSSLHGTEARATLRPLYDALARGIPTTHQRACAADFLRDALQQVALSADEVPVSPESLVPWMTANIQAVHAQYQQYLAQRQAGEPRRYFSNRAHALYFLREVSPTKLVDGAWLYGVCAHVDNPRLADLVRTYVEELGHGDPDKNHVTLYRGLLTRYGLDAVDDLPDAAYEQGLVQLALGWNAEEFLPEIIGFNLAYEQLPLHLPITAYELNELGIDPYYFTLHVTVDNADTGHARRACQAAWDAAPRLADGGEYWRRVRAGAKLGSLGRGTLDVIRGFDLETEVIRIMTHKAPAGHGAHSDFCQVGGRKVNDWLAQPDAIPAFLAALEKAGWIKKNQDASESRFWTLLQGPRAEMFGVFSPYELQVLHDWIRGEASADGRPYASTRHRSGHAANDAPPRSPSFRALQRRSAASGSRADLMAGSSGALDTDLPLLEAQLQGADATQQRELLLTAMSPALHWSPTGLFATRAFLQRADIA